MVLRINSIFEKEHFTENACRLTHEPAPNTEDTTLFTFAIGALGVECAAESHPWNVNFGEMVHNVVLHESRSITIYKPGHRKGNAPIARFGVSRLARRHQQNIFEDPFYTERYLFSFRTGSIPGESTMVASRTPNHTLLFDEKGIDTPLFTPEGKNVMDAWGQDGNTTCFHPFYVVLPVNTVPGLSSAVLAINMGTRIDRDTELTVTQNRNYERVTSVRDLAAPIAPAPFEVFLTSQRFR